MKLSNGSKLVLVSHYLYLLYFANYLSFDEYADLNTHMNTEWLPALEEHFQRYPL